MKKILFFAVLGFVCVGFCSCGSTWNIEGNNMTITKCDVDTIAPAGSYLMIPGTVE